MTVSSTVLRNDYTGTGSQTIFAFTFQVLEETNSQSGKDFTIKVLVTDSLGVTVEKIEDTDYTVQLAEDGTGTVTFTVAPLLTDAIALLRDVELTQNTDYINIGTDKFPGDSHEGTVDKLTLLVQQQQEELQRAVTLEESSTSSGITMATPVPNKILIVDANGNIISSTDDFTTIEADLGTVAAIDTEIITVAGISTDVTAVAGISADVTTVAGITADIATVAGISADVTIVAGDSANIGIVATNIADVNTTATNIASIIAAASLNFPILASGDVGKSIAVNAAFDGYDLVDPGTSGQVLTSAGVSSPPTFQDAAGGSMVLLATADASASSTIDFTSNIDSTYDYYQFVVTNLVPASTGTRLYLRTSTDGGSTYNSAANDYTVAYIKNSSGGLSGGHSGTETEVDLMTSYGASTSESAQVIVNMFGPANGTLTKFHAESVSDASSGTLYQVITSAQRNTSADVDAIRFLMSSGNITSGHFALYGIIKS